jgi:flavin-dependent dehydrogenase
MDSFHCTIVGGGPAGASLAWLLAGSGQRVLLIDDGRYRAAARRETMLAAARPGLERAGLWQVAAAAARTDPCRHGAIWGRDELVWQEPGEPGLLLERGRFDAALRQAAVERGAVLWLGWRPMRLPDEGCGEFCATTVDGAVRRAHSERFVVASGRQPRRELLPLHTTVAGAETAALTLGGAGAVGTAEAVVEAVPQGWWWWVGNGDGSGSATLLVDAGELAATGSRRLVQEAIAAARGPVRQLAGARPVHAVRATARQHRTTAPVLLLGDAAASIDPLSSQGVEKALAAADHAAAVLRTAGAEPSWWRRLLEVHSRWEHGLAAAHATTAAAFLAEETRFSAEPFWHRRRNTAPPRLSPWPGATMWRVAPQVAEAPVLVRRGARYEEQPGVVHAGTGEQLTHLGFVPVAPLLRPFRTPRGLAEGVLAAGADPRLFVLPMAAVHTAAAELVQRGFLVSGNAAAGNR